MFSKKKVTLTFESNLKIRPVRKIGILGLSAPMGDVELELGVQKLRGWGFEVKVHPVCFKNWRFFCGQDSERARAWIEMLKDDSIDAIWLGRGGSGSARVLRELQSLKIRKPLRRRLLLGYSDATSFLNLALQKFNLQPVHTAMPGVREFQFLSPEDERDLKSLFIEPQNLKLELEIDVLSRPGSRFGVNGLSGQLWGGNLSVLASLCGTSFAPWSKKPPGAFLFLEDVGESLYRLDRMIEQLAQSGALKGVKALLLGDFTDCSDAVYQVLKRKPKNDIERQEFLASRSLAGVLPSALRPLRKKWQENEYFKDLAQELAKKHGVYVFFGVPAGHGQRHCPLVFGQNWQINF